MKLKHLLIFGGIALATFAGIIAAGKANNHGFEEAKENIIMRKMGHEILLHAGDSTSRVMPVKKISDSEYQLQFESDFTFIPDTLVNSIRSIAKAYNLPENYIVNVIECTNKEVVFGFAVLGTQKKDIVPCNGRKQPKSCYFINLVFPRNEIAGIPAQYLSGAFLILLPALLFYGFWAYTKKIRTKALNDNERQMNNIRIGNYDFYQEQQYLISGSQKTTLTLKETKLLLIFANNPNIVIDRSRLQKEVWEDEGVITSRSLDMFVSKLRKKLADPSVRLTNVHGIGYKLEVE